MQTNSDVNNRNRVSHKQDKKSKTNMRRHGQNCNIYHVKSGRNCNNVHGKVAKIATSFFAATLRRNKGSEKLQTEEKLTGRFVI